MIQPIESVHEPTHGFTTSDGISIDWRATDPETVMFADYDRLVYLQDTEPAAERKVVGTLLRVALDFAREYPNGTLE